MDNGAREGGWLKEHAAALLEDIAREYAAEIGFNMQTEKHALFRMTAAVLSSEKLRQRWLDRLKESQND